MIKGILLNENFSHKAWGDIIEIGGLECAVYCSPMLFAAQLWAVKMADVVWQKAASGGFTVS